MIKRQGFSLVEAIISLVIVSMILAAGAWLFFANQRTTTLELTMSFVRANLRQALNVLGKDIVQAGMLSRASKFDFKGHLIRPIESGTIYHTYGLNIGKFTSYNPNYPDKIQIISPDPVNTAYAVQDVSAHSSTLSNIKIDANNTPTNINYQPKKGDYYIVTNANYIKDPFDPSSGVISNIFKLRNVTYTPQANDTPDHGHYRFRITPSLRESFSSGAGLTKVNIHYYFVKLYDNIDPPKLPELKCYIRNIHRSYVVAEGIEDMQIAYGVDLNNNGIIDTNEWIQDPLSISDNDYYKLRAIKVTLSAISKPLPASYLGAKIVGGNKTPHICFYKPFIGDEGNNNGNNNGNDVGTPNPFENKDLPVYRIIASETYYLRNFMPDSFYGNQ